MLKFFVYGKIYEVASTMLLITDTKRII